MVHLASAVHRVSMGEKSSECVVSRSKKDGEFFTKLIHFIIGNHGNDVMDGM
jgi:hypothetical protein